MHRHGTRLVLNMSWFDPFGYRLLGCVLFVEVLGRSSKGG